MRVLLQDGDLIWDKEKQGYILGSFFWGYLVTQIPGGWVATKFGGKRVFGWSMFVATVLTFLTPIAAQTSYIFIIVIRLLMGVVSVRRLVHYEYTDLVTVTVLVFHMGILLRGSTIGIDRISSVSLTYIMQTYLYHMYSIIIRFIEIREREERGG